MEKTLLALELEKEIRANYPKLWGFYQEWMGNFEFTENEVKENLDEILKWLMEHPKWFLLSENLYCDHEGRYYLTNYID